ncbi:MAG: hypothetical protein ACYTHM_22300 [Planctomycetota bacterium]
MKKRLCGIGLLIGFAAASVQSGETRKAEMTRATFAAAMSKIEEGTPAAQVRALLGDPDDIRTKNDPGGISACRVREVWNYGTEGHLTVPTLGSVYIGEDGKVMYVYGGKGQPPDPAVFPEETLRPVLRLLGQVQALNGYHFNPLILIRIVNTLQPMGKTKALTAIDEYLRVSAPLFDRNREGIFLVLRALFDVPKDPGAMPVMRVGAPSPRAPEDPKRFPRFPLLLLKDVPLMMVTGYSLAGSAEPVENHVAHFRKAGRLRAQPLAPEGHPLDLYPVFVEKALWLYKEQDIEGSNHFEGVGKRLIINQLLRMLDSVYRLEPDSFGFLFHARKDIDAKFRELSAKVKAVGALWNPDKNQFTFPDGSALPARPKKVYRRCIWDLKGFGFNAELILERTDGGHVSVDLRRESQASKALVQGVVKVLLVDGMEKKLYAFPVTNRLVGTSISGTVLRVPEGGKMRAELKLTDGTTHQSPVYAP